MSYVVTIKRDPAISEAELRDLSESDRTLSVLPGGSERVRGLVWLNRNGAPRMSLLLDNESLWSTPRDDAELAKMHEIAAKLRGQLFGEEGEKLSI